MSYSFRAGPLLRQFVAQYDERLPFLRVSEDFSTMLILDPTENPDGTSVLDRLGQTVAAIESLTADADLTDGERFLAGLLRNEISAIRDNFAHYIASVIEQIQVTEATVEDTGSHSLPTNDATISILSTQSSDQTEPNEVDHGTQEEPVEQRRKRRSRG